MTYPETRCFLATIVQEQGEVGVMWDGSCTAGLHIARRRVGEAAPVGTVPMPDTMDFDWTGHACDECGAPVPTDADALKRFASVSQIWDTADGTATTPGTMWWQEHQTERCFQWDNCSGRHLHVILPNGHPWNIDGRASNCNRRDDRTHRCWVREGEPPMVTAGKEGDTCSAGAGSILAGDYHGFLRDGLLTAG